MLLGTEKNPEVFPVLPFPLETERKVTSPEPARDLLIDATENLGLILEVLVSRHFFLFLAASLAS